MTDDMGTPEDAVVEPERSGLRANLRQRCTSAPTTSTSPASFKRGLVIAVLVVGDLHHQPRSPAA